MTDPRTDGDREQALELLDSEEAALEQEVMDLTRRLQGKAAEDTEEGVQAKGLSIHTPRDARGTGEDSSHDLQVCSEGEEDHFADADQEFFTPASSARTPSMSMHTGGGTPYFSVPPSAAPGSAFSRGLRADSDSFEDTTAGDSNCWTMTADSSDGIALRGSPVASSDGGREHSGSNGHEGQDGEEGTIEEQEESADAAYGDDGEEEEEGEEEEAAPARDEGEAEGEGIGGAAEKAGSWSDSLTLEQLRREAADSGAAPGSGDSSPVVGRLRSFRLEDVLAGEGGERAAASSPGDDSAPATGGEASPARKAEVMHKEATAGRAKGSHGQAAPKLSKQESKRVRVKHYANETVDRMLLRLQSLAWNRVDVTFKSGAHAFNSHNHIKEAKRGVAQHMIDLIAEFEQAATELGPYASTTIQFA
mmetsp:Transcript_37538/g.94876  ORF Transcript_37538/g.94876 Transcript_37538/m.94876 type:complete len:420 (-) Transcript_37538:176-1435(-)